MGHGVPVIAYASGGLKETVQEGKNGYLYSELNEESLYEKIQKLEELSETDYKKMCADARKASEKYSFEEFSRQMKAYVEKHVSERNKNA